MNIYRAFRLGPVNDLPAGTVLEAVVIAPEEGTARATVILDEQHDARAWIDLDRTRLELIGVTTAEYDDDGMSDPAAPHTLVVSHQVAK